MGTEYAPPTTRPLARRHAAAPTLGDAGPTEPGSAGRRAPRSNRGAQALLASLGPVMRCCGRGCDDADDLQIARKADGGTAAAGAANGAAQVVARPGRPLEPGVRHGMEARFGRDLGGVRIHTDTEAGSSARQLGARAYTVGSHIVFGAGEYAPRARVGEHVLAHELTHTLQQRDGRHLQRAGTVSDPSDPHEREAERVADVVAAGGVAPPMHQRAAPGVAHRDLLDDVLGAAGDVAEGAWETAKGAGETVLEGAKAGGEAVLEGVEAGVELAGEALDEIRELAGETWDLVQDIAAVLGGSISVSRCGARITAPRVPIDLTLAHEFDLGEVSVSLPTPPLIIPITGVVNAYGALYISATLQPMVSLQMGPFALEAFSVDVDWCSGAFAASGGLTYTVAGGLGGEVRGAVGGEVGVEITVVVPPGIPVPIMIPVASLEAGIAGGAMAVAGMRVTDTLALSYGGGLFRAERRQLADMGWRFTTGIGLFGGISVVGQNLCRLYLPLWTRSWEDTLSLDAMTTLGLSRSGVSLTATALLTRPGGLPFDDLGIALQTDVLTDQCPPLETACRALTALGWMPEQRGGDWSFSRTPPWGGPLPDVYPVNQYLDSKGLCRGACGPDCQTCDHDGDRRVCVESGGSHGWAVYPSFHDCPTHGACKTHDGCYDWCAGGRGPEGVGPLLCRRLCDLQCACHHNVGSCVGWIFGLGGSGRMHFSDPPYSEPGCEGPCPTLVTPGDATTPPVYQLCLPRVDLTGSLHAADAFEKQTPKVDLFNEWFVIYGVPVRAAVWARGRFRLSGSATLGPVYLANMCLTVMPGTATPYQGTAELHVPATLSGLIALSGDLGAALGWPCLVEAAEFVATLGGEGGATWDQNAFVVAAIDVECAGGRITLSADAVLDALLRAWVDVFAALRIELFGFEVYSDRWPQRVVDLERGWRWDVNLLRTTIGMSPTAGGAAGGAGAPAAAATTAGGAGLTADLVMLGFDGVSYLRRMLGADRDHEERQPGRSIWSRLLSLCDEEELPGDGGCDPPPTHVRFWSSADRGEHMRAAPLTQVAGNTTGSPPDQNIFKDVWDQCVKPAKQSGRWVRAHLLHGETSGSTHDLHGPGTTPQNLILTDKSINSLMSSRVEQPAIGAAHHDCKILYYEVEVDHFDDTGHRRFFGERVHMKWGEYDPTSGTETSAEFDAWITSNKGYQPPACPSFVPGP